MQNDRPILIAGGGPVGCITALALARQGIPVQVFEAEPRVNDTVSGSYLIGADGGRSTVRKALGIAFEGYTHPERFLVLTTPFAFDLESMTRSRYPRSSAACGAAKRRRISSSDTTASAGR